MTEDIDCSETIGWNDGAGFDPVGNDLGAFTGTLDGQNFVIDALFINRPTENYVGVFGHTDSFISTLDNINMTNVNITGNQFVGSLVGYNNRVHITNVHVQGSVTGNDGSIGGLAGRNRSVILSSSADVTVQGVQYVGGMVGNQYANSIEYSYATGDVTGTSVAAGGLVGLIQNGQIRFSYATGDVTGLVNIGGLVGNAATTGLTLWNAYATGNVSGTQYCGGLIGDFSTVSDYFSSTYAMGIPNCTMDNGGYNGKGTIIDEGNYWNTTTSGIGTSPAGEPLNDAEMKDPVNFFGWDFTNSWGQTAPNTYPCLQALTTGCVTP